MRDFFRILTVFQWLSTPVGESGLRAEVTVRRSRGIVRPAGQMGVSGRQSWGAVVVLCLSGFRSGLGWSAARRPVEGGSRVLILQRQPTATRSASDRLNVESSRLLCDDGHSASCPAGAGKSQTGHGVDGWAAAGLDAASRMRQESRAVTETGVGYRCRQTVKSKGVEPHSRLKAHRSDGRRRCPDLA